MSTKHTPGPWFSKRHQTVAKTFIRAVGDKLPGTCAIAEVCKRGDIGEREANACLIAAAPELLEVARSILVDDMLQYLPDEYIAKVRAVISKATGE